jgi:hypothetical protein
MHDIDKNEHGPGGFRFLFWTANVNVQENKTDLPSVGIGNELLDVTAEVKIGFEFLSG